MNNPYETLGVRQGASEAEIKIAYRELVKRYHPDQYDNNPLKDLAGEKMQEINEAYDYFQKNNFSVSKGYDTNSSQNNYSTAGDGTFQDIRNYINMNNLSRAEQELNRINNQNAEWFFLRGVISLKKGWYNQGFNDIQTAVSMDPSNYEYQQALNSAKMATNTYRNNSYYTQRTGNQDFCDTLTCLCCGDELCQCLGGSSFLCC